MLVRESVGERAGAGRSRQGHALALGWRHKLWNHPDLGSNPSSDTEHAWPGSSYILALHCGLLICKTKGAGRPTPQGYHEVDTTVMMGSAWPRQTQRSSKMSPCLDNRPPATAATALPTPSSPRGVCSLAGPAPYSSSDDPLLCPGEHGVQRGQRSCVWEDLGWLF